MPQTIEAFYHNGIVKLKQKPQGISKSRVLVIFLDEDETDESKSFNLNKIQASESSVDKWVGLIKNSDIGNWKAEKRAAIEGKPGENPR